MASPPRRPGAPLANRSDILLDIADAVRRSDSPIGLPVKVVAVDGHGGAGKSTLALELSELLGAEIIHTDDFASPENPVHWWPRLIEEALEPIARGAPSISYVRSSWGPGHAPEPATNQPVTPVMILEGVAASRREFRPYLAYAVWVDAPKDVCIARGVDRDGEAMREQWERWWRDEEAYIRDHRPVVFADAEVSGV
jgi:uridine kinase